MTSEELLQINPFSGEFEESYEIKLEKFEGPLDLLLYLIKKDEIEIYEIPISRITRQYLEYVEMMKLLNLDIAGEFILMAATLISIKAKMLLPRKDEVEEEDPREALILALLEYEKFKKVSHRLHEHESIELQYLKRADYSFIDLKIKETFTMEATIFDLLKAFKDAMDNLQQETYHTVNAEDVSIEERRDLIVKLLSGQDYVVFSELYADRPIKIVLIVTFLAILELIKMNRLVLRQSESFGEIRIFLNKNE